LALILGMRMGFEIHVVRPHNVPAVMLGCGLLFVGWFGFNGGSALAADGYAALAICGFFIAVLKRKLGWDDALDAFGCHGVGGIVGCILTGIFAIPELSFNGLGGLLYTGDPTLLINQCLSVLVTVVYVGAATAIIGLVAKALFSGSLRVGKDEETRGLDATVHGESGYPSFTGLDQ
jgi:Amt family ammonium transporter